MAKARQIVRRRKAVRNIRKITQTMQLISTARYQKCLQRAMASKPYTEKISEMVSTLAGLESVDHPLLKPNEGIGKSILLMITSNRGLAGAYNAQIIRTGSERLKAQQDAGMQPAIEMVGKKGIGYMRFLGQKTELNLTDIEDRIAYSRVAEIAERYMKLYEQKQIERVDVAYMRFLSVGVQRPVVEQLLPVEPPKADDNDANKTRPDFEFSPAPDVLLARLIPETVKIRLYQFFNDAIVSEQVARMVAMKAATDAAGDMIKYLTRQYNRARQTQITLELADIVGGAEAVSGA